MKQEPPHLWFGSSSVRSELHYDNVHNIYVQVLGKKTFYLSPVNGSSQYSQFYMYPRMHPSHRHSQIGFPGPVRATNGAFDDVVEGVDHLTSKLKPKAQMTKVTLGPGDALYIPAL